MARFPLAQLLVALLLALACGRPEPTPFVPDEPDAAPIVPATTDPDGGAPSNLDAGKPPAPDAGSPPDAGRADAAQSPACSPTEPRTPPARLAIFPEAGETPYVEVLARAQKSIRVMVYLMGRGGILDTLKKKAGEGKQVRVILDGGQGKQTNQKYFDELTAAGAKVLWSDPKFSYMHAKVILADEQEAIISTGNYSLWQLQQERNFGARLTDPADLAVLAALFDADWDRRSPDLSCTRLLIAPVNARERLLTLIDSAQKTLDIESMQFADTDVRNRVAARKRAGVNVRVILADPGWIDTNKDAATFLSAHGIPARYLVSPSVHVKAMVVDGTRAFLGSENLSWTSLTKNREVGLIDTEPGNVQGMSATFAQDWAAGKAF